MKNLKEIVFILALAVLLIPNYCNAQSKKTKQNLIITGITGESIKESIELDKSEKIIKKITKQVIKEKLAKNEKKTSFMLNNKEFIVNGVQQTSEIHLRYKNKYIKEKVNWNICKNYKI
ncbi:hypothetical protein ACIVBQ_002481 [Tenacibaculum discolor]